MFDFFDYNWHLPAISTPNSESVDLQHPDNKVRLNEAINQEFNLARYDWPELIKIASCKSLEECALGSNLMILDQEFIKSNDRLKKLNSLMRPDTVATALLDFRDEHAFDYVKSWKNSGGTGIKFHPYLQKITDHDFDKIVKICAYAEEQNLIINVDCSFGTLGLYEYSGPKLVCQIINTVKNVPVVCLHFGGPKVLEVHSLLHASSNLYVDLSLSLSYWKNSSVIPDLYYSISNMGSGRFIFGSDHPFININEAKSDFFEFVKKYNISDTDALKISGLNSLNLIGKIK